VDTGEWRYGQDGDNRPWTEPPAGPSPDLWPDEGAEAWTPTTSWRPRHQADPSGPSPISPTPIGQASDSGSYGSSYEGNGYETGNGYESGNGTYGSTTGAYGARAGAYPSGGYPIRGYSTGYTAPPRYGVVSSTPTSSAGTYGAGPFGSAPASGSTPISGAGSAMVRRPGLAPPTDARRGAEQRSRLNRLPEYLKVVWFTAAWYGGALVLYLLWLVIAGGDREALAGKQFVSALPWMFAAVLISGGLAMALRRLTVGWGAIGVSFAAAVIGAGLATIIHSFA
jgi:hypothetical protein